MASLSGNEIAAAGLTDWTYLLHGLQTRLVTKDFATGLRLVDRIGAAAEAADHHPDLDLRYPYVDVRLTSHDSGGVTERDLALARQISELAAAEGVEANPTVARVVEIALDTPDSAAVLPFWAAVLDMTPTGDEGPDQDLQDGVLPNLWFQESGDQEPRQRFHLDVWTAPNVAAERVAAAVAAGGTVVADDEAPALWVLADPDGNRVCLCTWEGRGE